MWLGEGRCTERRQQEHMAYVYATTLSYMDG